MSTESTGKPEHLVVVGSSAGGIEALGVLVASLPENFPAPVVLAQHLDPSRPSQLPTILERRSVLPVVTVVEDTKLQPGKIYVVPANRHVFIHDGKVGLAKNDGDRPRPSVDLLLSTAARSYGDRLVAVILTGSGSDGAAGAVEVKEHGGTVVIQNPRTAAYPSMPSALPPSAVDHICDLERIGAALNDIVRGATIHTRIETGNRDVLNEVLALVASHGSIDFTQYKTTTLLRRISRRMALNHFHTLEEYRDFLAGHPDEIDELVKALLIKVTEFFRDPEAFEFLATEVMPKIIERGRERGRVLRMWSAGCATGEESYSLALLVAQALGRELPEWRVKIFATDVDEDAVGFARRGYYPANVLRSLPQEFLGRYFEASEQGYRVAKPLRQTIIFGQQDLSRGSPFPNIDLVVCRNLLIYFKPELQQSVLDVFSYSLQRTNGYLFLGKAETARPSRAVYDIVNKKWKIYQCVSGSRPLPARKKDRLRSADRPDAASEAPERISEIRPDEQELRRANEVLFRSLPVGICLIDRTYRIISINAAARRLLGIRDAGIAQDFLHTVRGLPYPEVRSAIDRAFRERTAVVMPQVEIGGGVGDGLFLTLHVVPFEGSAETALVCVEDISETIQARRLLDAVQAEQSELAEELSTANRRLTEVNKELQDSNEEMQAANEEMTIAQEELQATNEEFEATNEELQATNEELETNNEELQATNEELETTNEELQARTSELQELTRFLTGERRRLAETVEQAPFDILVLRGQGLLVESMNPRLGPLFGNPSAVLNRPFEEECTGPGLEPVRAGVRNAFRDGRRWHSEFIRLGSAGSERTLQFTAIPTHSVDGDTDGVVLYVEDVTLRHLHEEQERLDKLKLMLEHADQLVMALFDAHDTRLVQASRPYLTTIGRLRQLPPEAAIGRPWKELWFGGAETGSKFDEVVRSGKPQRLHEVHVGGGLSPAVWDCSLIPIATKDGGEIDYVVLSAVEVTRPVLAREELEQLDRLKDNFLSLASHELRTPLTPLAAYVELLAQLMKEDRSGADSEKQVREVIAKLRRQIGYLSRLTEDLVDVARLRSGKLSLDLRPVELRRIAEEGRDLATAASAHPDVRLDVRTPELTVQADEMRMIQVVHNLLSNAVKHGGDGKGISVVVSDRRESGRRWARVEVRDFGAGIPAPYRSGLFQRFLQPQRAGRTARAGLGLGLFISARIVEQHGGRIGAEHHDPGTTVWFELPALI
jgi:two-component system, chemotaxis family, CheB/CheR fusion protein